MDRERDIPEPLTEGARPKRLALRCSPYFLDWLETTNVSLAVSTYRTNRLFLLGRKPDGGLSAFERLFDGAMGLHATAAGLALAGRCQIWHLGATAPGAQRYRDYDRLYVPRIAHITGELRIHDVAVGDDRRTWFVNTLYSCIAHTSEKANFEPVWHPPFVSRLVPEDRCHLNGLAMRGDRPRYATAAARCDTAYGWRDRRNDSGCVIDIDSGEILAAGLTMPHSPRWHDGRLWVLNSGTGELGRIDTQCGRFEPVAFCPGYLRGLAFHSGYAVVGLSLPRANGLFTGLSLDDRLRDRRTSPRCGLWIVELSTGRVAHWLEFEGPVRELYDVAVLPGVRRPAAIGLRTDEIARVIRFVEDGAPTIHAISDNPPRPGPAPAPESAGRPSPGPDASYRSEHLTLAAALDRFEALTFPSLSRQAAAHTINEPLLAACARRRGEMVGLGLAELSADGRAARLLSLFVRPADRRRGVAAALLSALAEAAGREGARRLEVAFRSDWPATATLERLLGRLGWTSPQPVMLLFKGTMDDIAAARWIRRCPPPPGYEIFPWAELRAHERRDLLARERSAPWYPRTLSPFQEEARLEPINSLGLRHHGEVVGWIITHRLVADTIQYTTLFVRRDLRRLGRALPLLAEAVRRQMISGVPKGTCAVQPHNRAMAAYMRRRFVPYGISLSELRRSRKELAYAAGRLRPRIA